MPISPQAHIQFCPVFTCRELTGNKCTVVTQPKSRASASSATPAYSISFAKSLRKSALQKLSQISYSRHSTVQHYKPQWTAIAVRGYFIPIPKTTVDKFNGINAVCHRWTFSPYDSMLSSPSLTYSISAHHLCLLTF